MSKIKKQKLRFQCWKCEQRFISDPARVRHISEDHKPPRKTEQKFIRDGEPHNLLNGINLKLGDKVLLTKKGIITKITLTEGSNLANVEISVSKDVWEKDYV